MNIFEPNEYRTFLTTLSSEGLRETLSRNNEEWLPIERQRREVGIKNVLIENEIWYRHLKREWPNAAITNDQIIAEITPTSNPGDIVTACERIKKNGLTPTHIFLDKLSSKFVLVCIRNPDIVQS